MPRRWTPAICLALLTGCGFMPSGALEGKVEALPATLESIHGVDVIRLETNPDEPYSVPLWIVAADETLYVHAGANRAKWVEHIELDDTVRLGVEGSIYELRAERVHEQAEFDSFADVYEVKYGNRPRNENVAEAYLYRLHPLK